TRYAPTALMLVEPARQKRHDLDEGLESPYAENILREMDADGKLGLKTAPDSLLDDAKRWTRGYPRALEALYAILSTDRSATLRNCSRAQTVRRRMWSRRWWGRRTAGWTRERSG
ncbi:MAG: hypothetical protein WKH64_03550, partial [Chloroflexia bacterium]